MTTNTSLTEQPDRAAATGTPPPCTAGRVVAASLAVGVVTALVLTLVVFSGAPEHVIVGAAVVASGLFWGLLAGLTDRYTSQPQRWARVPAITATVSGLALWAFAPGAAALTTLGWVWSPVAIALAVWMFVQVRRTQSGRGRWLLYPVVVAVGVAGVGAMAENVTTSRAEHRWAAPGHRYDVGGRRMHLDCTGTGGPTVVLENGLGEMSAEWARIVPVVGTRTRVCAFDRAGQGWSDDTSHPLDGVRSARDLHQLLSRAGERGPFVLAGHSTGGTYALTYAHRYPEQVAGMVLLDSSSPDQTTAIPSFAGEYAVTRRVVALLPGLARIGLGHLNSGGRDLPQPAADQVGAYSSSARGLRSVRDEQSVLLDVLTQAQALTSLHGKPLVVLTASQNLRETPGWGGAQDRMAALSTNSSHRVETATHVGLLEDAHDAAASARAITDVVDAVRTGTRVAGASR